MTTENLPRSQVKEILLSALSFLVLIYATFFGLDLIVGDTRSTPSQLYLPPFMLAIGVVLSGRPGKRDWNSVILAGAFITLLVTGIAFVYQLAMDTVSLIYLALFPGIAILLLAFQASFDFIFLSSPVQRQWQRLKQSSVYGAVCVVVFLFVIALGIGGVVYFQFLLA